MEDLEKRITKLEVGMAAVADMLVMVRDMMNLIMADVKSVARVAHIHEGMKHGSDQEEG